MNSEPLDDPTLLWLTTIERMVKQKSYKPVLLLSIISEFEEGAINENRIPFSENIINRFNSFYESIGNKQGIDKSFLPFYYLQSDIWDIKWRDEAPPYPTSDTGSKRNIDYAYFKPGFFEVLNDPVQREIIKQRLLLKAEEDIKFRDPNKNQDFNPPRNVNALLEDHFGRIDVNSLPKLELDALDIQFNQEKILQELLVEKWNEIPNFSGLEIYGGSSYGVEYDTRAVGRIDILARNLNTECLTVIELKKDQGSERHLGQILRYMGWVRSKISQGLEVEGILIASSFKESLFMALKMVPNVSLLRYDLLFKLTNVKY